MTSSQQAAAALMILAFARGLALAQEFPDVRAKDQSLTIWFSRQPEVAFGIDLRNDALLVVEHGVKPYAPRISSLRGLSYQRDSGQLVVSLELTGGAPRSVTFAPLDDGAWEALRSFVAKNLQGQILLSP